MNVHIAIRKHSSFRAWVLALFCTLSSIGPAMAQTCESPMVVISDHTTFIDTCATGDSLPLLGGGIPSPHNDAVLTFHMVPGLSGNLWIDASFQAAAFLMPSPCGPDTPLLGVSETPTSITLDGLPNGAYFLVVSGNPDVSMPVCGTAQIIPNVTMTEVIFRSGFQTGS